MAAEKADVLLIGPPKPVIVNGLAGAFNIVKLPDAKERDKFFVESGPGVGAVPFACHWRRLAVGVSYRHYPKLIDMARDVDMLMVIAPGGAETKNLINAEGLGALGPKGILINMSRGSVVDEPALIKALQDKTILSAGLDVFAREPEVPAELLAMDHVVLFPHVGSASVATREKMDQLVVDNLLAWAAGKPPLTPVPETPWPPKQQKRA